MKQKNNKGAENDIDLPQVDLICRFSRANQELVERTFRKSSMTVMKKIEMHE